MEEGARLVGGAGGGHGGRGRGWDGGAPPEAEEEWTLIPENRAGLSRK